MLLDASFYMTILTFLSYISEDQIPKILSYMSLHKHKTKMNTGYFTVTEEAIVNISLSS